MFSLILEVTANALRINIRFVKTFLSSNFSLLIDTNTLLIINDCPHLFSVGKGQGIQQ